MSLTVTLIVACLSHTVGFYDAYASSTYMNGEHGQSIQYSATNALTYGSTYWLSSAKTVSWTGVIGASIQCNGIQVSWSHAPYKVRILTRSNDMQTRDVTGWIYIHEGQQSSTIDFNRAVTATEVVIVMQSANENGLVGISHVSLVSDKDQNVMLISGTTSEQEKCFVVENGMVSQTGALVTLEPCIDAIASVDRRGQFILTTSGTIQSVGNKCFTNVDGHVELGACDDLVDGRNIWTVTRDAKLQSGSGGCVSHPDYRETRLSSENMRVSATSSTPDHPAESVIDANSETYWSTVSNKVPQSITFEFMSDIRVSAVSIEWKHIARVFTIQIATQNGQWTNLYTVTSNIDVRSNLYGQTGIARKMRIILHANANNDEAYAVTSVKVDTSSTELITRDCDLAGNGSDLVFIQPMSVNSETSDSALAFKETMLQYNAVLSELRQYISDIGSLQGKSHSCDKQEFLDMKSVRTYPTEFKLMNDNHSSKELKQSDIVLSSSNEVSNAQFEATLATAMSSLDSFEASYNGF